MLSRFDTSSTAHNIPNLALLRDHYGKLVPKVGFQLALATIYIR